MSTGSIMTNVDEVLRLREPQAVRAFVAAAIFASVTRASTGCRLMADGGKIEEEARTPTVLGVAFCQGYVSERHEPVPKAGVEARASAGRAGRGKGAARA
jgi:hypothetical protein